VAGRADEGLPRAPTHQGVKEGHSQSRGSDFLLASTGRHVATDAEH